MNKEYNYRQIEREFSFYRNNIIKYTAVHIGNKDYNVVSVNPTADSATLKERIKYLINGE